MHFAFVMDQVIQILSVWEYVCDFGIEGHFVKENT